MLVKETFIMLTSIKDKKEAAFELEFQYKKSENSILLHDLRLEVNGRIAHIDHLVVTRGLFVYAFETKSFKSGVKINDRGEFTSWNSYWKCYEGIPSPIVQNLRNAAVLNDFFKDHKMLTRFGFKLTPNIIPFVLISGESMVNRLENFNTISVIKSDVLARKVEKHIEKTSVIGSMSRLVSRHKLAKIGELLKRSHKPIKTNYLAKFGLQEVEKAKAVV